MPVVRDRCRDHRLRMGPRNDEVRSHIHLGSLVRGHPRIMEVVVLVAFVEGAGEIAGVVDPKWSLCSAANKLLIRISTFSYPPGRITSVVSSVTMNGKDNRGSPL